MFINEHPNYISKSKNKKDSLLYKIKQLFKFGKTEKSKESSYYFRQLTDEFLRNERYYYDREENASILTKRRPTDLHVDAENKKESSQIIQKTPDSKSRKLSPFDTNKSNKFKISPSVLHQRSRSEDLLTLKSKTKNLDNTKKTSPTGHKSLSDRIKRMVGIGKRTKSRENILHLTDPVQYFLNHERFYYDGEPNLKLYNRSVSLMNQSGKISTLRRKTDNSLSTETTPHQDENDGISAKPPTGRRRQERRSEEGKSKRRSRTLSPAQKLVSKFKSIMQREDKNKEEKENSEFLKNETEKFLENQKNFVDVNPPSKHMFVQNQKNSSNNLEHNSTKQQTETLSASTHISSDSPKTDPAVNSYHQTVNNKINAHEFNPTPMKPASSSKNEEINFYNTKFLKYQTEMFLHNMKKYNDFDKAVNDVNKTLIFINNKTLSKPQDISTVNESGEAVHKLVENMQHSNSMNDKIHEKCTLNKNFYNQLSEQNLTVPSTSQISNEYPENCKDLSKQKSFSETVKCRTFKKEEVIMRSVISEKIQTKSITISNSKEVYFHDQQNIVSPEKNDTETEKALKNVSKEKHIENRIITSVEKMDHSSIQASNSNKHDGTKDNILPAASIAPPNQSTEATTSRRENIPKKLGSISETNSKKNLIMTNPLIDIEKGVVHSDKERYQSILPASNANRPKIEKKKSKESSAHKKTSLIIDQDMSTQTRENDRLIRKQTAEFLNQLKKYSNELEGSKKSSIIWLSEKKIIPQKFVDINQENHNSNSTQEINSENNDHDYLTYIFNKKQTDVFLKDHKNYHDKQRMEDNKFIQKSTKPQNKLFISTDIPEKHKLKTKIKKLLSPTTSKKIQYCSDERPYPLLMNQTTEFLNRNQYLIHKDEVNFHNSDISFGVPDEKGGPCVKSEHSMLKNEANQKLKNSKTKTRGNTISKMKSFLTSSPKPSQIEEDHKLIKQQTIDFLEDSKKYNNKEYESSSKYKILWISENEIISRKVGEVLGKNISSNKINEYCSNKNDTKEEGLMYIKNQTDIFLKDHKDYHNKQRIEDNKFHQIVRKQENKLLLSTSHNKENAIVRGFKNLISPTSSKKSQRSNEQKTHQQLIDETSEFLNRNQYLIHKEEINLMNLHHSENPTEKKESRALKVTTNQLNKPKDDDQTISKHTKRQKKSTLSKIKSLIAGNPKQLPDKKEFISTIKQTTEFLEDMKNNTHREYEVSSKYKINWLSDNGILPQKIVKSTEQNIPKKIEKNYKNVDKAHDRESFALINALIKEQNNTFLKEHKDYHDGQRNEENKFYQKVGKPEEKLWLSYKNEKRNVVVRKIEKLISPLFSKKLRHHSDINSFSVLREQTAKFLDKNQYFIHKQEIKFEPTHISESVEKETHQSKVTAKQGTQTEGELEQISPHKTENQKKNTFSESLTDSSLKKLPGEKIHILIKNQTIEFLEDLKRNTNEDYEVSSESKIIWLNENINLPQKIDNIPEKSLSTKIKKIYRNVEKSHSNKAFKIIKDQNDTFLKNHKDYHDMQRSEDNKFYQKIEKPVHKLWLASNNDKKNFSSKDQTTEFPKKNPFPLHKDEMNFITANDPAVESVQGKTDVLGKSAYQPVMQTNQLNQTSPSYNGKSNNGSSSRISSISASADQHPDKNYCRFIKQQTIDFLEDSRNYNNKELEALLKSKIVWLCKSEIIPKRPDGKLDKEISTKIIEGCKNAENLSNKKTLLFIKEHSDSFFKDHKDYHNRQRIEDNNFYNKTGKTEEELWLSTRIPEKSSITKNIKGLASPNSSKKTQHLSNEKMYLSLKNQTAEFLMKNRYLIHEEELNLNMLNSLPYKAEERDINLSKVTESPLSVPKDISKNRNSSNYKEKETNKAFSSIKPLLNVKPKSPFTEKHDNLTKPKVSEFLEDVRVCNDKAFDHSSGHKILWLSEKEAKQQIDDILVKSDTFKEDLGQKANLHNLRETDLYLKQQSASFLNNDKNYHDKERSEPNALDGRECKTEEKNNSPSHTPNPKSLKSKMRKLLSPPNSKESLVIYNDENYQYLLNQTENFLIKHQYLIHREEVNFKKKLAYADSAEKNPIKTKKVRKNTLSKIKSAISGATKQRSQSNYKMISAQTAEFLENLKRYNDIQYETSSKMKVPSVNAQNTITQNQNEVPLKNISEHKNSGTPSHKSDVFSKSEITFDNKCDLTSRKAITKIEEKKLERISLEDTVETDNSEYKSYLILKQKTDTFLNDLKSYHDNQRIEDNNFFQKIGKPEKKFWLSSTNPSKNRIANKIKKLLSPTLSKKPQQSNKENSYLLVKNKTAEFLEKNQYLIHEEELNQKNIHNISDETCEQQTRPVMNITTNQPPFSENARDQIPENTIRKVNNNPFSKIKSYITGSQKQPQKEQDHKIIMQQTSKFLEDLKIYTNEESDMTSNRTVRWLSEKKIVPSTVAEIDQENNSKILIPRKRSEGLEQKVLTKFVKECKSTPETSDDTETYEYIKKRTDSFLKKHKDYHNNQRIEDNKFYQKSGKSENEFWLFSNHPKKNTINHKIQQLISPAVSKSLKHSTDSKAYLVLRDKTDEFLKKNQYLIHEEEINPKFYSIDESVKKETDISTVTVNEQSVSKNTVASNKQKKGTFSKIKSLITGKRNPSLKEEDNRLLRKKTAEFLEHLKEYNRKEYDVTSMKKIVWLCDQEIIPQKIEEAKLSAEVIEENRSDENNTNYQKHNILTKKQNDTFLEDHKDYHNKQRIEDNKFIQKFCEAEEKSGLSVNIPKKNIIGRKIKKFLSPNVSKKSNQTINEKTNQILRDETEKFLNGNQYLIYKEEVHPKTVINKASLELEYVVNRQESSSLSTVPRNDCRIEMENATKSSETNNKNIIGKQEEDSINSNKPNNSQNEANCLSDNDITSKNRNEPLQQPPQNVINRNEVQVLKALNDNFLRDHIEYNNKQWNDYKLPQKVRTLDQKLSMSSNTEKKDKSMSEESTTLEDLDGSPSNTNASGKKIISKLYSEKLQPKESNVTNNDITVNNPSNELYEHIKENDDVNKKSVLLFSNDQKQPPTIKKKVTFSDYQESNEDEKCLHNETDEFEMIKQKTQLFLKKNQDYHNVQWGDYRRFHRKNLETEEKNSPSQTSESLPVSLEAKYIESCEEELDENKVKPKPTPRKSRTSQKLTSKQNNSHEVYLLMRKNVLLFLQDHQSYHNKERQEFINFATDQKKHLENTTKTSCPKESKSKSKLISKLKSLVEGSAEIFSSDNRKKDNDLRKQTAEFLISQKCFWDLQRTAEITFAGKQDPTKYNRETEIKPDCSETVSENTFHQKKKNKKQITPEKLPLIMADNSIPQSSHDDQKKEYEFLRRKNELFLKDHQTYHNSQLEDFLSFSVSRKQNHDESPTKDKNIQNTIPQNSSNNRKSPEMDNSIKNKIEPPVKNEQNIDAEQIHNICEIFLNNQRYYINSANEGWRRYVMYKPEAAILKKTISKSKSSNSKKHSSSKTFPKLNNQQYSETEGQRIDYEVNLHKTKLFLENHKHYHDNLQNEFANYVPKNIYRNDISEPQPRDKKDGVLDKIKSIFPSSHNKMSYNVQKQKLTSHNQKEKTETENEPVITKFKESLHMIDSRFHGEDVSNTILKEQTDLFLKDHQHYHNRQHADSIKYFDNKSNEVQLLEEENDKNKRTKKSMMSKMKSLLGSDSSKKSKNKKIQDEDFFKTPTKLFLEDQIQYSHIEKSAEQIFNESKPKHEVRNFESTTIDSSRSVLILKNNEERPTIENNGQHAKPESNDHRKDEEYPVNKASLGGNKKESNISSTGNEKTHINETSVTDKNTINLSNLTLYDNEILDETATPLLSSAISNVSENERKNYAREKLQTHEFLLNEKQFASTGRNHNLIYSSEPLQSANIKSISYGIMHKGMSKLEDENIEISEKKTIFSSRNDVGSISSCNLEDTNSRVVSNVKESFIQPADKNENYTMKEKSNMDSSLVERVERPMSPTKTIFKELRTRDNSPDNRVYILSEGYTITREANEGGKVISTKNLQTQQYEPIHNASQENTNSIKHPVIPHMENPDAEKILGPSRSTGQDSTSDSNEYLPSQRISQGELAVRQHSK
ncbi:hypothetical protein WA026_017735, partial [Henosepilachna vigintioctopunctata]